jgi:hypothetical protein
MKELALQQRWFQGLSNKEKKHNFGDKDGNLFKNNYHNIYD